MTTLAKRTSAKECTVQLVLNKGDNNNELVTTKIGRVDEVATDDDNEFLYFKKQGDIVAGFDYGSVLGYYLEE